MNEPVTRAARYFLRLQRDGHFPSAVEVIQHAIGAGVRPDVLLVLVHGHQRERVLPSRVERGDAEMIEAIELATRSGGFAHVVQLVPANLEVN